MKPQSMSDLSRSSSRDSRRLRGSTESRISRYSDEELLEEIQRRGLHSTGESTRADLDRQSSGSHGSTSSRPSSLSKPPKYPTSRWSPLVGASQATTPLETPRVSSYTPLETPIALETPNFTPVVGMSTRHRWSPEETPPETPTFSKTYYDIDDDGWIVADSRGNLVISDLKDLIDVYMLRHMFTNWKKVHEIVSMRALMQLRPKLAKLLSIIYYLKQTDYTYNESIDAVTNMGPPLLSQTGKYLDFVKRTPDDKDEDIYPQTRRSARRGLSQRSEHV
ncbi:hypothetical protein L7F22_003901 [Adiantum nelumboides]|nr:hypothetical protein [Adiantum nelumboides]